MERFAFVIHPLSAEDFTRKFAFTRRLPARWVESLFRLVPPLEVSHITGVRSPTGAEAEGWFIGLPLTPRTLFESDLRFVYRRLLQCARLSERLGAQILGLGAFTAIVGDAGVTLAAGARIAVTTGNSYTAATGVEGALLAAQRVGIGLAEAHAVVVGATGSIGAVCSRMLARRLPRVTVVARNTERLGKLHDLIRSESAAEVAVSTDVRSGVADGDIVLTVSSATDALIEPEDLKPGAVVCDVARPRNVSRAVHERRDDVLVIDGSVIQPPGNVDFGFDFGLPPGLCDACMAETMILALEGRYTSFTLGRDLTLEQVEEIAALGRRHGFRLAGFRRFERAVPDEEVERIRQHTGRGGVRVADGAVRPRAAPSPGGL
jgi:predicted amino acid dehydrogenase